MDKWIIKKIADIAEVVSGGTPSTDIPEFWNGDVSWITPADLSGYKYRYISKGVRNISKTGLDNSSANLLPKNTVLLSSRAPIGYVAIAESELATNQGFKNLICDDAQIDYRFMYYWLQLNVDVLKSFATGATFPEISATTLKKIKVFLPGRKTQQKIANVLSAYDDLIEANNRRIELLEQTAQELYKEWFVRLRFPGHEHTKFEKGLPQGWKRNKIQKYYRTCSGGTPSRSKPEYFSNGIYPWVKTGEIKDCVIIDTEEYITEDAVNASSAKVLPAKSVAMAMYGVNIGLLAYFDEKMTCNQACCVFSDKRTFSSKHYLYYYLKFIREYLLLISFGAAQQNLSQELIKKIKIIMPSDAIVQAFEKQIDDIYDNVRILLEKNRNLTKQRDMLLPRLMSGKLKV